MPAPVAGAAAYNAFIQPFIDKYGYVNAAGVRTGGGFNGYATQLNDQDFFRDQFQVGYNLTLGATIHELHWVSVRRPGVPAAQLNGWGEITIPGARL